MVGAPAPFAALAAPSAVNIGHCTMSVRVAQIVAQNGAAAHGYAARPKLDKLGVASSSLASPTPGIPPRQNGIPVVFPGFPLTCR